MLTNAQIAAGWKAHDGGRKPDNWNGGPTLFSDQSTGIPPGWAWAPFNDLQVIAYIPENANG